MGVKKGKRLPRDVRRQKRWWRIFQGWSPNQGMGHGWRLVIRKAAGAQPYPKKKGQ